jgi:hypothetical protein
MGMLSVIARRPIGLPQQLYAWTPRVIWAVGFGI